MTGRIVVMGVSGAGKSHIGAALAEARGAAFLDGDSLHPAANIAKMSRGEPLTDADRAPWLDRVGGALRADGTVVACSALKRVYRDRIAAAAGAPVHFVCLTGSREVLTQRMGAREGHFMPASLLDSQLATLELPGPDEPAIHVSIEQTPEAIVAQAVAALREAT